MNLETSNLAHRWTAVSTNEKNAKLGQKVSRGGYVNHFLEFLDPIISRGRMKLGTSNLTQRWMAVSNNEKNAKLGQKGIMWGSRDPLFGILGPSNSETIEARNFKFGIELDDSLH